MVQLSISHPVKHQAITSWTHIDWDVWCHITPVGCSELKRFIYLYSYSMNSMKQVLRLVEWHVIYISCINACLSLRLCRYNLIIVSYVSENYFDKTMKKQLPVSCLCDFLIYKSSTRNDRSILLNHAVMWQCFDVYSMVLICESSKQWKVPVWDKMTFSWCTEFYVCLYVKILYENSLVDFYFLRQFVWHMPLPNSLG